MLTKIKKLLKYVVLISLTMLLLFLLQVIVDTAVWKILELLLIPLALAIGIWWLNKNEKENEQKRAEIKEKNEKEIARNKQQETILEEYFDRMTYLLLEKNLRESAHNDEVRGIAQARTITTLARLDNERKPKVILFLYQSRLLHNPPIIGLQKADLCNLDLSGMYLQNANFSFCDFSGSIFNGATMNDVELRNAILKRADMKGAKLHGANLYGCNLSDANLEGAEFCVDRRKFNSPGNMYMEEHGADLHLANLKNANLKNAFLKNTNFHDANLEMANLTNADFTDARLNHTKFKGAILDGAIFDRTQIYSIDLRDLDIEISKLSKAESFSGCILLNGERINGFTYEDLQKGLKNTSQKV